MTSVVEALGDRIVGTVEEVSANRITVLLSTEAPQATALNTGVPAGFPRINGYVLIPNESGATVCIVSSVRVERLPFPKRRGTQKDFGLIDLPFPSRVMALTPLGTLRARAVEGELNFEVRRGVDVFPSVGDPVLLPGRDQLRAIVEGENTENQGRILLGHCPTAGRAPVHVDPDKLFGRHLAVLGNTGAGKSCSVAGLVRWSLAAAEEERKRTERDGPPNARFIILDPNGEYAHAFKDLGVRLFSVEPKEGDGSEALKVPAWLWNGEEWAAFTGAAPGVQRPILFQAIRRLRAGMETPESFDARVAATVHPYRSVFRVAHATREYLRFPGMKNVVIALEGAEGDLHGLASRAESDGHQHAGMLRQLVDACGAAAQAGRDGQHYQAIDPPRVASVLDALEEIAVAFGVADSNEVEEDLPVAFDPSELHGYVEALAGLMPGRDLSQFIDTLNLRIRGLLTGGRLSAILKPNDSGAIQLDEWLNDYAGADHAENGAIAVIDLSLVPSEVIYIVVSVLARLLFEAVQRYRRQEGKELPTTLILEEAHTFVHHDLTKEGAPPAARACARVFERIAREGRKFGLGLVLASQRPYEVSPTVLSQCNTFLLHRIVNDRDQELVKKLVPDGLGTLLRDLPSLPSRRAILLGWAAPAPVLVEVREVPEEQRPHSPDPAFWDVWTGAKERRIDWERIARDWQGGGDADEAADGAGDKPPEIHAPEALLAEDAGVDDDELPF